jgi:ABC-2 type transport system ATP-binding protein
VTSNHPWAGRIPPSGTLSFLREREGIPVLELEGLSKRYGDVVALDGLSFTVQPGQMFGFVGTNGAGKTTAMRIVLGVLEPDAGNVRWQGQTVDAAIRRRFGYMPEERGLYPKMRVRRHLEYLAELHGAGPQRAVESASRWMDELGVGERADDRVEALSLGNQQRVQLAAALVHDPEVLVLDEPFSGLDPVGVDALARALKARVDQGVPVVFSSHQLELVERLCDAVGIIQRGRLVAQGTVAELRAYGRAARGRQVRVAVDAPRGWVDGLPGVTVLSDDATGTVVELADRADDQALLDRARRVGSVREFAPVEPTLVELFREVVSG